MSKTVIAIDPVTRLEGHLKVEVQVEDGKVADAWITGGMFRGFEAILRGRTAHLRRVPCGPRNGVIPCD